MSRRKEILKIVIIYAIFGILWIYFSDTLVRDIIVNPKIGTLISILKGIFSIIFTSLLLFVVLNRVSKKVDQLLASSKEIEERFNFMMKNISDCLFVVGDDLKIKYISENAQKMFGYKPVALVGKVLGSRLHPDDYNNIMNDLDFIIRNPDRVMLSKFRSQHENGEWIICEAITQNFIKEAAIKGIVCSIRDITERCKSEEKTNRLQEQLNHAIRMESIGRLAGGIAHDFNNILSGIYGYSEMLEQVVEQDSRAQVYNSRILEAANRAKGLVNQILTLSRQDDHEQSPILVVPIVKEALTLLRSSIPATIEFKKSFDPKYPGKVFADPTHIHQIIMNLCTNSYHAMKDKDAGVLGVAIKEVVMESYAESSIFDLKPGRYIVIEISDTGTGIPRGLQRKIFEPYFTTKEKGEGTGLGLAVVNGIIEGYNGKINIYSEENIGTTFKIYLPYFEDLEEACEESDKNISSLDNLKILLVDDERMIADVYAQMLMKEGHDVIVFNDSLKAYEEYQSEEKNYDLIITDMNMPKMNGLELSKKILEQDQQMKIIIMTGFSDVLSQTVAEDVGIKGFLHKPALRKVILQEIKRVLHY